jgi:hypothetical protein
MNQRLAHLLTRLYPRRWRQRYGEEFEAFLIEQKATTSPNVLSSAVSERIFPTQGANMETDPNSFGIVIEQPSTFLPLAMSLTALTMVLGYLAINGIPHESDEGTVAHLWQILMAGRLPVIAFFAIKWLRRAPRQAIGVLALQATAVLASMAPVFFLKM